jgi:uncharacterized lipoprotein YddW (UPF0748 family)
MIKMDFFGMWHRPFESNIEEVDQTLMTLKSINITDLFVETFFNGKLIFSSNKSILKPHEFIQSYGIYGDDLLLAFIEMGKKYQIKIHAWVENFFVGQYPSEDSIPFKELYTSYFIRNRDGSILQKNEKNYLFIDPANPKVQQYLLDIYQDIANHQGLCSLHLDYIRYPLSFHQECMDLSDDNGYTTYAMHQFMNIHQLTGDFFELTNTDEKILALWQTYKINQIHHLVQNIRSFMPNLKISTAVFGNPDYAKKTKMQDWMHWVNHGWIDFIIPMAYYKDTNAIFNEISTMKQMIKEIPIYAGLAPSYMGLSSDLEIQSIKSAIEANADGVVLFASQKYLDAHFNGKSDHQEIRKHIKNNVYVKGDAYVPMD